MAKLKLSEELRKEQAAAEAAAIEKEIALKRKRTEEKLQAKKMREHFTKRVTSRIKVRDLHTNVVISCSRVIF